MMISLTKFKRDFLPFDKFASRVNPAGEMFELVCLKLISVEADIDVETFVQRVPVRHIGSSSAEALSEDWGLQTLVSLYNCDFLFAPLNVTFQHDVPAAYCEEAVINIPKGTVFSGVSVAGLRRLNEDGVHAIQYVVVDPVFAARVPIIFQGTSIDTELGRCTYMGHDLGIRIRPVDRVDKSTPFFTVGDFRIGDTEAKVSLPMTENNEYFLSINHSMYAINVVEWPSIEEDDMSD